MRKLKLVLMVFLVVFFTLITANAQSRTAKIFFVNCYEANVDIRLGEEDNPVFLFTNLEPFSSTRLQITKQLGSYALWFKLASEKEWYYWADDDNKAYQCDVVAGKNHCIIAGVDGTIHYFTITEDIRGGSHVTFLNGSNDTLSTMEISKEFGVDDGLASYAENLNPNEITNFGTFEPDTYHLYWQFPSQKKEDTFFFYPDDTGEKEEDFFFKKKNYYLFLAYTQGRDDYAVLYNITPLK